jgi:hypothetical protein
MVQLTKIFRNVTQASITKVRGESNYNLYFVNNGQLEVVLMYGKQYESTGSKKSIPLEDLYIKRDRGYWVVVKVEETFPINSGFVNCKRLHLQVGMKIHLNERNGTYDVDKLLVDGTVEISCNTWAYRNDHPDSIIIKRSSIKCLAGGLHNYRFLDKAINKK